MSRYRKIKTPKEVKYTDNTPPYGHYFHPVLSMRNKEGYEAHVCKGRWSNSEKEFYLWIGKEGDFLVVESWPTEVIKCLARHMSKEVI